MKIYSSRRNYYDDLSYWVGRDIWVKASLKDAKEFGGSPLYYATPVYVKLWETLDDNTYKVSSIADNMLDDPDNISDTWVKYVVSPKGRHNLLDISRAFTCKDIQIKKPLEVYTTEEIEIIFDNITKNYYENLR